ncbi:MAG: hypothetical protein WCJ64_12325 [Rhodospirillaceae bacterium]
MIRRSFAAALVAASIGAWMPGAALAQAQGSTGTDAAPAAAAPADPNALGDGEKAALGCGIAASGALLATYVAGPSEVTLLWGGGLLVPSGSIPLALSLLGQIGASFCAIGALATPTVLWAYDQSGAIAAELLHASADAGRSLVAVLGLDGGAPRTGSARLAAMPPQ